MMVQLFISQHPIDRRPGDDDLPHVRASASVEARRIIADILTTGLRIDGDVVVLSYGAQHRMALAIERIAAHGLENSDGFFPSDITKSDAVTAWAFELGDLVQICKMLHGTEIAVITGRAEHALSERQYMVRYVDRQGRATQRWWDETALSPFMSAPPNADECALVGLKLQTEFGDALGKSEVKP